MSLRKVLITASTILLISTFDNHQFRSPFSAQFPHSEVIPIDGAVGPESLSFDPTNEGPYTGVSDGRIIKWNANKWVDFAITSPEREGCGGPHYYHDRTEHICGRPLGLEFNKETGDLYIADAYMGLLVVGPNGGLASKLATKAQFANGLCIDQNNGVVYFTDSSSIYPRRNYVSAIISGDKSGRLIKYDPKTDETTVILSNLSFPNGVSLSKNGEFILVAETTNCRILKFWVKTPKAGLVEVFANLNGFPDNIKRNNKSEFWVGIHSRRGIFFKWVLSNSWIGKLLIKILFPLDLTKIMSYLDDFIGCGLGIKLSEDGKILDKLEDKFGKVWRSASEVIEENGNLWIGSVKMPFLVKLNSTN